MLLKLNGTTECYDSALALLSDRLPYLLPQQVRHRLVRLAQRHPQRISPFGEQ